jgi:hypothetical protein
VKNLVFICNPGKGNVDDFCEVSRAIERRAPEISARVLTSLRLRSALFEVLKLARRPTLAIQIDRDADLPLLRGPRLAHRRSGGKLVQYAELAAAGIPVAPWVEIRAETVLDPAEWGPYVVVKPSRGRRGAFVTIQGTGRVRYNPPEDFPEGHFGRRSPMLAQKFVYTGRWPVAYRVMTYFGRPVVAIRYDGRCNSAPLESAGGFGDSGGRSVVAAAMGCTISMIRDQEILELARRSHAVFPDNPSLGIDIVREEPTRALYVMEVNPSGNSWMLTNEGGRRIQAEFALDFHAQFDALDVIAERSIELARERAR